MDSVNCRLCGKEIENVTHTHTQRGQIEGTRDRGKLRITYLVNLSEWISEEGLGEITDIIY